MNSVYNEKLLIIDILMPALQNNCLNIKLLQNLIDFKSSLEFYLLRYRQALRLITYLIIEFEWDRAFRILLAMPLLLIFDFQVAF